MRNQAGRRAPIRIPRSSIVPSLDSAFLVEFISKAPRISVSSAVGGNAGRAGTIATSQGDRPMGQTDQTVSADRLSHANWRDIPVERLSPLIDRQFLVGTGIMIARVLLKRGAVVPLHHHHNEQVTYILEGALQFLLKTEAGDREIVVRAGEVLCIPPNLPHEALALEDTVDLDIFNPPRQDWIDGDDAYLRGSK